MEQEKTFKLGALVRCNAFKGEASIVSGPNKKGEYQLCLGHLLFWVKGSELREANIKKKRPRSGREALHALQGHSRSEDIRIDLHAHKVADAIEVLEQAIDRAILANAARIEVIHGFGTGAVRRAVEQYLSTCKHIVRYRLDENNHGTTWAYLE